MQQIVYLTGFMGSGKTTVGEGLGKAVGVQVIDTDQWIEQTEGETIKELFQTKGEQYFREKETEALAKIQQTPLIVTTGGGIVLKEQNRELMKKKGIVVFLDCKIDEIFDRVAGDSTRPLLQNKSKADIKKIFDERKTYYLEAATIVFDTSGKSVMQIVQELKEILLKK
ncbi:shikimate kinase [Alkalihalobacillus sp. 1P02AB]|uniref:shikimate kinase n=1 Tax=Alkalihalobacillus sp. 1P02AB TaxID=3132260 RepID=UPI0039A6B141